MAKKINFFVEDIEFALKNKQVLRTWIFDTIQTYQSKAGEINYIFCSDEYLRKINIEYLAHDYYTDIITFDSSEEEGVIAGDMYISIERITDNAQQLQTSFEQELYRVLIHGILHLIGYADDTDENKAEMRVLENKALQRLSL